MTDEELIELLFARSEDAVEALRRQYGAYCRAIAGQLLSDGRDVEECLSDCWLSVWNAVPPARPSHFKGWLGAIVRNRALVIGRQNRRRPEMVDEAALELASCLPAREDAHAAAEAEELGQAVSAFLRQQKEEVRTVFLRRYWYADSVEETARRLGWSVSKTKSVLFRTRNKLKTYLSQEGFLNETGTGDECAESH